MKDKHTPGPWTLEASMMNKARFFLANPKDRFAAELMPLGATPEQAAANGRLIAAAPAMLDALRTTAGNIRSLGPAGAIPFYPYIEWLRVIEETIEAATGEKA